MHEQIDKICAESRRGKQRISGRVEGGEQIRLDPNRVKESGENYSEQIGVRIS